MIALAEPAPVRFSHALSQTSVCIFRILLTMSEYDFRNLSDYDFEVLIRDLLTEHLGVYFQGFKRGRDGGVDLRYSSTSSEDIIAQCKHYIRTPVKKLLTDAKAEQKKLKALNPARYIIATSLELSDGNKSSLLSNLAPYCKSSNDVFSSQDINYLLSIYPHVEQRHPKLWLSSSAVLDKFVNNDVISRTRVLFEEISEDAAKYVQNSSFLEAKEIIDSLRYCIISGIPGIGKTTLAKMLLLQYSIEGYDPVYVSSDIEEAYRLLKPETKQAIYFDDFLGKTKFNPPSMNFDKRLLDFIRTVKRSKNTIFILTTREYILSQATSYYEDLELNRSILADGKCIINLSNYSRGQKALILYNHLYHSHLENGDLNSIRPPGVIRRITNHPNYSPRIIDWVIKNKDVSPGENLADKLINALDKPKEIWRPAFERHLSQSSKGIIRLIFAFGDLSLETLRSEYIVYMDHLQKNGRLHASEINFEDDLRELEGSFIKINSHKHIGFHNPSIIDYLEDYFQVNYQELYAIIDSVSSQKLFWDFIRKVYPEYDLRSEPANSLLKHSTAIEKVKSAGTRLNSLIKDVMSLDEQRFHMQNLNYCAHVMNRIDKSDPLRELFISYINSLLATKNLFLDVRLKNLQTLVLLAGFYTYVPKIQTAIDSFIDLEIDSATDLSRLEEISALMRVIKFDGLVKERFNTTLDRLMRLEALEIEESFSSSRLSTFEQMYELWEDMEYSDTQIESALEIVYRNKEMIESGEIEDEDFEAEPDEDYEREPSSEGFQEDTVDYDDVVDLIDDLIDDGIS